MIYKDTLYLMVLPGPSFNENNPGRSLRYNEYILCLDFIEIAIDPGGIIILDGLNLNQPLLMIVVNGF